MAVKAVCTAESADLTLESFFFSFDLQALQPARDITKALSLFARLCPDTLLPGNQRHLLSFH